MERLSTTAKVLLDSVAPSGKRLTTFELVFPRIILAEFNTHRALSRNAASSRAIPTSKLLERVTVSPFVPKEWGSNQKGMQAGAPLDEDTAREAYHIWIDAREEMMAACRKLSALGVHKQIANRLLEPWQYVTVIASATEWNNLFWLRCHPDAQPQFQELAFAMLAAYNSSTPREVPVGGWHLPMTDDIDDGAYSLLQRVATGRMARVSYLTHDGQRDIMADVELHDRLATSGHWSPFEHVAQALADGNERSGNYIGWCQYRSGFPDENRTEGFRPPLSLR